MGACAGAAQTSGADIAAIAAFVEKELAGEFMM